MSSLCKYTKTAMANQPMGTCMFALRGMSVREHAIYSKHGLGIYSKRDKLWPGYIQG